MPVTRNKLAGIELEVTMAYKNGLAAAPKPIWDRIAQLIPMKSKVVEAPIAGMVGPLREWVGPRVVEQLARDAYSIKAKKFEKTVGIPRESVDDDTYGVYMGQMSGLGVQAQLWPDQQVMAKLEAGETDKCYDGLAFFHASHPYENGNTAAGTFPNLTGSGSPAWYAFDTTQAIKPMIWGLRDAPEFVNKWSSDDHHSLWFDEYLSFVRARGVADYGFPQFAHKCKNALDATNFETVLTTMTAIKTVSGENLGARPNLIVIPTILEPSAIKLFGTPTLANGADNPWYKACEYVVSPRLSNT